jgi:hypothetical protein
MQMQRARLEALRKFLGWQRLADEPALNMITSHLGQKRALCFGFHAFCDEFQIERLRETDHRANDCLIVSGG